MSNNAKFIEINEDVEVIQDIARVASEVLKKEFNINISVHEAIPTIWYAFTDQVIKRLSKEKSMDADTEINLMDVLTVGISYRESEDGEKDGNFTPYAIPGQVFKTTIKSDEVTEDEE